MVWHRAAIFGASGGIGKALAQYLANAGAQVFAGARSGDVPDHQNIMPLVFDLLDETSIAAAVA